MDNTESTSPVIDLISDEPVVKLSAVLVAFFYTGKDNGVEKEGFDSRVVQAPEGVLITSADDVKAIANALANSEFQNGKKYEGLEITILHLTRLPL